MTDHTAGRPKLSAGPTLSDQAYAALREGITTGRYAAGQRLTERELADDLGVSPTPVREALRRLEHERLIERDAARMIRVADPSQARLQDLTLIEGALRGVAARLAAERVTEAETAAIQAAYDRAEELLNAPDAERHAEELLVLSRRFHTLVDAASHNRTLIDMIATATAFDMAFRVKWSSHVHRSRDTIDPRQQQHHTSPWRSGRVTGDLAEQTMREHIRGRARSSRSRPSTTTAAADRLSRPAPGVSWQYAGFSPACYST